MGMSVTQVPVTHTAYHHPTAYRSAPTLLDRVSNFFSTPTGRMVGMAGLGAAGLGAASLLPSPLVRVAAPAGGALLGWSKGADLLRSSSLGRTAVGHVAASPLGRYLGADPFKPVGGALGALAGLALGRWLS